jgi:REP element-mobilizing transposase RayT
VPQSLSSIYLHAVFSTKNREPFLIDPIVRSQIHAYLAGVTNKLECPALEIGGVGDHVHVLARFPRTITVADWLKELKRVSSGFGKVRNPRFAWQSGYGVFSVDGSKLEPVVQYIRSQEEHHRKFSFVEEFRHLMRDYGTEWSEEYVWD